MISVTMLHHKKNSNKSPKNGGKFLKFYFELNKANYQLFFNNYGLSQRNQIYPYFYQYNESHTYTNNVGVNYGLTIRIDQLSNNLGKSSTKDDFKGIAGTLSSPDE